jgi:hypothetical protein
VLKESRRLTIASLWRGDVRCAPNGSTRRKMLRATFASPSGLRLQRVLCVVVVAIVVLATLYALWIGVSNFSRIRV